MTLGIPFNKTKLSMVLLATVFAASACSTLPAETSNINSKPAIETETNKAQATTAASRLDTTNWAESIQACSNDYKKLIEPEINKFSSQALAYEQLFNKNTGRIDLANQLPQTESVQCKQQALSIVEQMNQAKVEAAQNELNKTNLSEADKREALSNLLYAQQALFFSYVRHGLISNDGQDVQLWLQANDIWTKWLNEPIAFSDGDAMVNTLMINRALISTVGQLTDYLQNYSTELKQQPKKKELLLNQTLIFLAQAEANNRKVSQSLDKAVESLPWLKAVTTQLSDETKTNKNSAQKLSVNETEEALLKVLQRDESEYFTKLLKLTALRYQDINEEKLLESAKTFLTEEVEDLALSELLTAMDYAKIGDQESSKRWLDKAFTHNDIVNDICQLPDLNPASLNPFFNEKNGKWLLAEINKQCS
ncbi:hypothetical protein [Psychrobacter phenylpyruvicus]|uniref:Lipoprotein n=1 Tax=Psychrobacter phenylpyruvicus TaxID=29432 RepID=A0A379LKL9_9GAMM|nr:hypothetical protein [Psychrobacter phenylpyruvicus]SUD91160.1 Uncharacterised protein [Psychrobacter phenylpyruvicus]